MKTFIIAATIAISIVSGIAGAKSIAPSTSTSFATMRLASPDPATNSRFTETRRCIVRQRAFEGGEPIVKFISDCEQPIIMVFCILTIADGWSCCSNTEYTGQQLVERGDFHAFSSRDLAESEPDNSFAIGCVPAKIGPAQRSLNPLNIGSVPDDPCYLAIQTLYRALLRNPLRNPREISKELGISAEDTDIRAIDDEATRSGYP
jgi:hypothetical protein